MHEMTFGTLGRGVLHRAIEKSMMKKERRSAVSLCDSVTRHPAATGMGSFSEMFIQEDFLSGRVTSVQRLLK